PIRARHASSKVVFPIQLVPTKVALTISPMTHVHKGFRSFVSFYKERRYKLSWLIHTSREWSLSSIRCRLFMIVAEYVFSCNTVGYHANANPWLFRRQFEWTNSVAEDYPSFPLARTRYSSQFDS